MIKSHWAEQQETSNKLQDAENTKTGIKAETVDIKEETKLMTVEDVSEKLGTLHWPVTFISPGMIVMWMLIFFSFCLNSPCN